MATLLNATQLTHDYLSPAVMEETFGPYRHAAGCVVAFCERPSSAAGCAVTHLWPSTRFRPCLAMLPLPTAVRMCSQLC
jgi:hypothetical protein